MSGEINEDGELNFSDDEDPCLEKRHQIVEEIEAFVDEPPIRHDVVPESDSEDEDGGINLGAHDFRRSDEGLFIGRTFSCKEDFAEAVLTYALKGCLNIKRERYDKMNLAYCCVGGNCNWRVYCAKHGGRQVWEITVMNDKHICIPNGECDMLKVPVIASLFKDKLREEPEYYLPMKIAATIKENWGITASRPQCQAARNKALRWIQLEYDQQFQRMRDYKAEILHSNPQSTVAIETLRSAEGLDLFNCFYVCFDRLKASWKDNCRPVIGVDGAHLKSKMKGQLLAAIGRDANNGIYPIAWAVVQVENTPNWAWFLNKLKDDLGLENGEGYVLVSDRQKGLIHAVEEELPNIEHRMCVRHIYNNLKTKHPKKPEMKRLVWALAWSYNEPAYKYNLNKILMYDEGVYNDVISTKPQTWCRVFHKPGSNCEDVHNNFTESWNATVVRVRERPLIPMLEIIARQSMVRISTRFNQAVEHKGVCTPYAVEALKEVLPSAMECRVLCGTNMMYQVLLHGVSYQVSLATRTCSCKKWDIRGIPCEHGYAVILSRQFEVERFVEHWFRSDTWRKTYQEGITPTRGSSFWPVDEGADVYMPSSPPQPGRKKKQKRRKGVHESPKKKKQKKRIMHCGICGLPNHNSKGHAKATGGQPSASALTVVGQPSGSQSSEWIVTGSQPSSTT